MVDVFISYAWSERRKEWVLLLAGLLRYSGFEVALDQDLRYGTSLSAFMKEAANAAHVLLVVDEAYVEKANSLPDSGVAEENRIVKNAIANKPEGWLAAIAIDNPKFILPAWLQDIKPKSFDFNNYGHGDMLALMRDLVRDLWRWMEGLPANTTHEVSLALMRARAARIEQIDELRDPSHWSTPDVQGRVFFEYSYAPNKCYKIGLQEYEFNFAVSDCGKDSIYFYNYCCHSIGLAPSFDLIAKDAAQFVTPCQSLQLKIGHYAVLQNDSGCLCLIKLLHVVRESFEGVYVPASIDFEYRILVEEDFE